MRIILDTAGTIIQVLLVCFFSKLFFRTNFMYNITYVSLVSIYIVSFMLVAGIMEASLAMEYNSRASLLLALTNAGAIAVLLIANYAFVTISKQSISLHETQRQLQNKILMEQHNEQLIEINEQMKTWRHDFHNHLQTLVVVARTQDRGSLEDYVLKLGHEILAVDNLCNTGDKVLDAILSAKLALAKSSRIAFSLDAKPISPLPLADTDKTSLFGNLMDNAIEACRRVDTENRFIKLSMEMMQKMVSIRISNSTDGTELMDNGKFVTTKSEKKFHGLGIPHIDRIVESAGGLVHREHKNNVFTTVILFEVVEATS